MPAQWAKSDWYSIIEQLVNIKNTMYNVKLHVQYAVIEHSACAENTI